MKFHIKSKLDICFQTVFVELFSIIDFMLISFSILSMIVNFASLMRS